MDGPRAGRRARSGQKTVNPSIPEDGKVLFHQLLYKQQYERTSFEFKEVLGLGSSK